MTTTPDNAETRGVAHILVVDDEEWLRSHTRRHLAKSGFSCDVAADAAEARLALVESAYDVLLCDVRMPGESGLELIEFVAAAHPDISIVMISGIDDTDIAERALELGAVGYLVKPFERNELLINVSSALHRRQWREKTRRHEARLEELVELRANYDLLTGVPNRNLLRSQLELLLNGAPGRRSAVMFCDLDHLKVVNDSLGHDAGDEILKAVADRLRRNVDEHDMVARFGGDKFVLVVDSVTGVQDAAAIAEKLILTLQEPHEVLGRTLHMSATFGIAIVESGRDNAETALRDADAAMYQAKALGRSTYRVADDVTRVRARQRLDTEHDLRRALDEGQLLLYYQPKFSLATDAVVGVEALVRWRHPELGLVLPGDFIPIAEETGLIVPLGRWVLQQACHDLVRFRGLGPHRSDLTMAVNVSASQLSRGDLTLDVEDALGATGLPPECLVLELTESILVEGISPSTTTLDALKGLGVRLSIDDFGTGYSSLSYIGRLPVDELKIDRSFVVDLHEDGGAKLVEGIIGLAKAIGHEVVAEGIETPEQLASLKAQACDMAQGFLLGRPQSADDLAEILAAD